ncbi:MAG: NAD(P)-binding domain-containing protein [Candidatus Eisenbacteria bacterium]
MTMLLTTLGFAVLSGLLVWWQVRAHGDRTAAAPTKVSRCPRCQAALPPGAQECARCHAPLMAYELVMAPVAKAPVAGEDDGPLHAIVRADVCVGCGTCVAACPEPGAIQIVDKLARVDLDLCKGHAQCAAACPVSAIVLTRGAAVQHVEAPDLTVHFESNVPGLYVVGELGGRGLIKNAINEGKLAIEHVARVLPPGAARADGEAGAVDVAIVGSGPAGLSAALAAIQAGLTCVVLEQGTLSDTIQRYPRQKLLFAEPIKMPLYGDLWVADASKESLLRIWRDMIVRAKLDVRTGQRVTDVVREGSLFSVRTPDHVHRARRVVLAMGRRGSPRKLEVPGEQLDHVFYDIAEMEEFAGRRVLVVGGGDSAVESALGLANQPGTSVALSYRGLAFDRAKQRNRAKLDTAVAGNKVRLLLDSQVQEIRKGTAALSLQGRPHVEPAEVVIVRVGGESPTPFLERAGVRIVRKEIALAATGAEPGR